MAKVSLGTTTSLDSNYRYMMRHLMLDVPVAKLCKMLGISESCFYVHKRRPELVTVRELRILRRSGKFTDEQILSIIREEDKP